MDIQRCDLVPPTNGDLGHVVEGSHPLSTLLPIVRWIFGVVTPFHSQIETLTISCKGVTVLQSLVHYVMEFGRFSALQSSNGNLSRIVEGAILQ